MPAVNVKICVNKRRRSEQQSRISRFCQVVDDIVGHVDAKGADANDSYDINCIVSRL